MPSIHFFPTRGSRSVATPTGDLTDVTDLLDDIEDRADLLLAELASILVDAS